MTKKKDYNKIRKEIIDYFYKNHNKNTEDDLAKKFNVSKPFISQTLSKEFKRRFERVRKWHKI
jgi:uncharacterized membrane protein|tara:strand:+ start:151 stop:339 length:189 start_codon:yes stop_codon:yes gene_type:complete